MIVWFVIAFIARERGLVLCLIATAVNERTLHASREVENATLVPSAMQSHGGE
jgi:hypothetical protein